MSQASDPGAKLIASYRAATGLRPDQRERALRKLQARLSADPTPSFGPEVSVPELPPPLPAAWVQLRARWQRFVTVSKVIVGAALLTWLATTPDERAAGAAVATNAARSATASRASSRLEEATSAPPQLAARGAAGARDKQPSEGEPARVAQSPREAPHLDDKHIGVSSAASSRAAPSERVAATPASLRAHTSPTRVRSARAPGLDVSNEFDGAGRDRDSHLSAQRAGEAASDSRPHVPDVQVEANVPERAAQQLEAQMLERSGRQPEARVPERSAPQLGQRLPDRRAQQLGAASLEQETALLEQAQAALKRGDAQRALHLLAEHTWLFPAGHLAEARDVARVLALCQAGHAAQARSRAASFLAARPHSVFAARVRSSCPDANKPSSTR